MFDLAGFELQARSHDPDVREAAAEWQELRPVLRAWFAALERYLRPWSFTFQEDGAVRQGHVFLGRLCMRLFNFDKEIGIVLLEVGAYTIPDCAHVEVQFQPYGSAYLSVEAYVAARRIQEFVEQTWGEVLDIRSTRHIYIMS